MRRAKSKMASDTTLVFIGPTLSADEARELLPDATILPPAAVGDILRAAHDPHVRRIAIIDGYFERMAAVWHKEILVALERGIEVWGASSMGALRAAELEAFGMRGVGQIFQWFRRGAFTNDDLGVGGRSAHEWAAADDEVAVAHLPAEYGFRAVSDALVNIRYNVEAAVGAGVLKRGTADKLSALARARFYRERSWARLFEDAREAKLPARELAAFESAPKVDRKAEDARQLLNAMRKARAGRKQPRRKIRVPRTWALRQLERLML